MPPPSRPSWPCPRATRGLGCSARALPLLPHLRHAAAAAAAAAAALQLRLWPSIDRERGAPGSSAKLAHCVRIVCSVLRRHFAESHSYRADALVAAHQER